MIRETAEGVELSIRVIPRAKKTELGGVRDGVTVVRIAAPPVDDAANESLIAFLARLFQRPRRDVRLVGGARSRLKRVAIAGVTAATAQQILQAPGSSPGSRI